MSALPPSILIHVNGEPRQATPDQPLLDLVGALGLHPGGILVEHNGTALLRGEWDHTHLREGDRLEILRVVAGG